MSVRQLLADERAELLTLLRELTDEEFDALSLCAGWRIRDVVGHLLWDGISAPKYLAAMARGGFSLNRTNEMLVDRTRTLSTTDLVARYAAASEASRISSLSPFAARVTLSDTVIHQQDIRRPLGRARDIAPERLLTVLGHPDPFARAGRYLRGLRWTATDVTWSRGKGPLVRGPGEALAMAMVGRAAALDNLEGDGVDIVRRRCGSTLS